MLKIAKKCVRIPVRW